MDALIIKAEQLMEEFTKNIEDAQYNIRQSEGTAAMYTERLVAYRKRKSELEMFLHEHKDSSLQ